MDAGKGVTSSSFLHCLCNFQEYAAGGSLQDLLEAQMEDPRVQLYSLPEAIRWARQIASGVLLLHDYKPKVTRCFWSDTQGGLFRG